LKNENISFDFMKMKKKSFVSYYFALTKKRKVCFLVFRILCTRKKKRNEIRYLMLTKIGKKSKKDEKKSSLVSTDMGGGL